MIDWARNQKLLIEESEPRIVALQAENRDRGDEIVAIGYVFEFGRGQLEFDLCANTARNLAQCLERGEPAEDARWNSGDFDYPCGIPGDFSEGWWNELTNLNQLAENDANKRAVYDGVVEICCQALADFARRGVIPVSAELAFNVADLLDELDLVKSRDHYIRSLIEDAP